MVGGATWHDAAPFLHVMLNRVKHLSVIPWEADAALPAVELSVV